MALRFLLVCIFTLLTLNAQAGTATLLDRPIQFSIPTGYCEIGGLPPDEELVDRQKKAIGTSNQVLAMFADCNELEDYRKGNRTILDNYGQILAQKPKGHLRALKGVSRKEYIQNISAHSNYMADALNKAEARVRQYIPDYQSHENLGILNTDSNGLYFGILMTINDETGHPRKIIGVIGMTLVNEIPISINLYRVYRDTPNLRGLLTQQQSALASFVSENN